MTTTRRSLYLRGTTSRIASYWRGSRSAASIPEHAILTETSIPILTEYGQYIETES